MLIASLANPKVKTVVKLRQRSHRDELGLMLVEGYREIKRALEHAYRPTQLFYCEDLFLKGTNEPALIEQARAAGAEIHPCTAPVFLKMAYRERPEGLLAVGPQPHLGLADLTLPPHALLLVGEGIEKPGNLGTMLRSADAAGAAAVIVCDRCTDPYNPNVVRASTGTLFSMPVVETEGPALREFLRAHGFSILAATPHAAHIHTEVDLTGNVAIVVGAEQFGLTPAWLEAADIQVRIPMMGMADSLNVSAATTILLFEALRQRLAAGIVTAPAHLPNVREA
jgi:TrmH family RNA methyltransferase